MKFIGQYIQSLIARFRNDVYLEDISTGTIASGGNLGLDSNNKIVKAAEVGSDVDLTSEVTGTLPVANGGTGLTSLSTLLNSNVDHDTLTNFVAAEHYRWDTDISGTATINAANIPTLNQNTTGQAGTVATIAGLAPNTATTAAAQTNITSLGTLTNLQVDFINANASTLTITDSSDTGDLFSIATTTHGATTITTVDDDAHAANLLFTLDGDFTVNNTEFGLTKFTSDGFEIENAPLAGAAALTIDNNDVDQHALHVAASNTTAHAVRVDAKSVTTKAGIFLDCDALTTGNALYIDVDDVTTETATKSLIALDYLKPETGASQISTTTGLDINFSGGAGLHPSATVNMTGVDVALDVLNNTGTVTQTGYSATLTDGDVATTVGYFSNVEDGGIDFKAVSSADTGDMFTISTTTNGATTLTTTDDDLAAAHFEVAADGDITLDAAADIVLEAGGGDVNVTTDTFAISSTNLADPLLSLSCLHASAGSARLDFIKDKGAAGAGDDFLGLITFKGDNTAQEITSFASISAQVSRADDGGEAGKLTLSVAESNGSSSQLTAGLILEGEHNTDGEVDVTIAAGSASTTTIAGTLTMGSTATLDNSGLLQVAGQTNITSVGALTGLTTSGAIELGHASDTTIARSAAGTVTIEGNQIMTASVAKGNLVHVMLKDHNSYLFYMFNDDFWYSSGSSTLAVLGSSTDPSDISSANSEHQSRVASYIAPQACVVKKLCFSFYWSSSVVNDADIDFGFSKFTPISDGTAASITMNKIAATDHNGSYTEVKPYYKAFTFSGANASLAAGDAFAFHMRTTGATTTTQRLLVYGTATLEIELS